MNNISKDFNEYKGFLISVGILLGGYFQCIGLWGIGFEYIRFFSSTQIISDGILGVITIIFIFGLFELGKSIKWLALTVFISSFILSSFAYWHNHYSISIFLAVGILAPIGNFLEFISIKVKNLNKIEHLAKKFSIGISQGIGLTVMLGVFGIVSTYIGSTPNSLFINDKIKTEQALLGTGTKLQYFNDKYIFLVNDSDNLRKVKILKNDEFFYK